MMLSIFSCVYLPFIWHTIYGEVSVQIFVLKTELLSCWLLKFFIYTLYNIINTFIIKTAYCLTLLVDIWFLKETAKVSQNVIRKVQTNFQTWDTKETFGEDTLWMDFWNHPEYKYFLTSIKLTWLAIYYMVVSRSFHPAVSQFR